VSRAGADPSDDERQARKQQRDAGPSRPARCGHHGQHGRDCSLRGTLARRSWFTSGFWPGRSCWWRWRITTWAGPRPIWTRCRAC